MLAGAAVLLLGLRRGVVLTLLAAAAAGLGPRWPGGRSRTELTYMLAPDPETSPPMLDDALSSVSPKNSA